jgi:hypothetical protein
MTHGRDAGSPKTGTCGCSHRDCTICFDPGEKIVQKQNHRREKRDLSANEEHGRMRLKRFHTNRLRESVAKIRDAQEQEDRKVKLATRESEPLDA